MDFMNENQSAHGDREYGHIVSRMRIERKVVVGHWSDSVVVGKIASWMRTAVGIIRTNPVNRYKTKTCNFLSVTFFTLLHLFREK